MAHREQNLLSCVAETETALGAKARKEVRDELQRNRVSEAHTGPQAAFLVLRPPPNPGILKPLRESLLHACTRVLRPHPAPCLFLSIRDISSNFSYKGLTDAQWENLTHPSEGRTVSS